MATKRIKKKFNPVFNRGTKDINQTAYKVTKFLFIVFLLVILWGMIIFRKTLIDPAILWRLSFSGAAMASILVFVFCKEVKEIFWMFIFCGCIGAGLLYAGPLIVNRSFAESTVKSEIFEIIRTGNLGRSRRSPCSSPYAVIKFHRLQKQLVFPCLYEHTIGSYSRVKLEYSEGLFGFPVVRKQILIE